MRDTRDTLLPHTLQSRALGDHVAFVFNGTLVTLLTQVLGTMGAVAAAQQMQQPTAGRLPFAER